MLPPRTGESIRTWVPGKAKLCGVEMLYIVGSWLEEVGGSPKRV